MSDTIIRVENLGKKYIIGHQQEGGAHYVALRDVLADGVKSLWKRFQNPKLLLSVSEASKFQNNKEEFWALKDVSFEVKRGEAIGIIGRNGAGKSTLLKILSRITEPTTGRVAIKGRVASLLEVGTGFHPELTGRENIFLNGAILGMTRAEINRKFDEIVDFAEVERFLDTPVKHYSSGMYVRLAFAVAAHLEPEILVVDEVLAVGDAAFQKKCLGKMGDVASKEGRTVLFVSHNMGTIQGLCNKAILLNNGILKEQGEAFEVIEKYLNDNVFENNYTSCLAKHLNRKKNAQIILQEVEVYCDGILSTNLIMGGNLKIIVHFKSEQPINNMRFGIPIEDYTGRIVVNFSPSHQNPNLIQHSLRQGSISCNIPCLPLVSGQYYITFIIGNSYCELDRIDRAIKINVESSDIFNTGKFPDKSNGIFYANAYWELDNVIE